MQVDPKLTAVKPSERTAHALLDDPAAWGWLLVALLALLPLRAALG